MAQLILYGTGSLAAWFIGRNIASRATNNTIDYLLNSNADSNIKDVHVVKSISGLLDTYREMNSRHPAYEAMMAIREGLNKLKGAIEAAQIRKNVHEEGYLSRYRTYDASQDNKKIESLTEDLMKRLEIFSTLLKCHGNHV